MQRIVYGILIQTFATGVLRAVPYQFKYGEQWRYEVFGPVESESEEQAMLICHLNYARATPGAIAAFLEIL